MKNKLIIALAVCVWSMPAFAANPDTVVAKDKPDFAQKRAEILAHLGEKIARVQQEQACVEAATSSAELKACREKFRAERQERRANKEQAKRP